jgi:hypothetical protein
MSYNTAFKKIVCCLTIPMVASAIALTNQKTASALSSASTPSYETSYDPSIVIPTISVSPTQLVSRYATYSFRLTNRQSNSIHYFYASPTNVDSWEKDILGRDVLSPGETIRVSIDDGRSSCIYDFKAVFSDGSTSTHYGVNVCNLSGYDF